MAILKKSTMEHRTLLYPRGIFKPEDLLSFVQLPSFTRHWKRLKLTDDDLRELEVCIMADPKVGKIIPRTGGVRKIRAVPDSWHMGKRGALRVCYVYFSDVFIVVLAAAYGKNRKEDLSEQEKSAMRMIIPELYKDFSRERKRKE